MIDAQRAGVAQSGAHDANEELIAVGGERLGMQRRQTPVLPVFGIAVGRRTDRCAADEELWKRPGVAAVGRAADGQILIEPEPQAGQSADGGGVRELTIDSEL